MDLSIMRLLLFFLITAFLQCSCVLTTAVDVDVDHRPYKRLGNDTDSNTTTAAPSASPHGNSTNTTTAAPSVAPAPHNNTNTTTAAPSPAPTNHTNATTSAPTQAPTPPKKDPTSAPTSSPTKKYTPEPDDENKNKKKKKKSFIHKFFSFIGWVLLIGVLGLGIVGCMQHRTQVYFFLLGLWHTIREACETFTFRMGLVCAGIGRSIRSARITDRIYDAWGRIRGLGGGGNRSNFANDEDGSMLQGLLLRENA